MTEIDPTAKLVCIPTSQPPSVPSIKITATCGHEVWVSDSSLPIVLNGNEVLCATCALQMAEVIHAIEQGQVASAPGALAEIERAMGPHLRDQVEAELRERGIHIHD